MILLLDAHALLWWLADDARLGPEARVLMAGGRLVVSVASLWEIAIKAGLGRLEAEVGVVARAADTQGIGRLAISDAHLERYQGLARRDDHGDPFDRMLVAQALVEDIPILTSDAKLGLYPAATIAATR